MQKTKSIALILGVLAMSFLVGYLVLAWTEPTTTPPGGNVPAPLNVGNVAQTKIGGLILNTGGAPIGLIVDKGNVGIGKMAPAQKLDVGGNIQGITGIFTGSGAVTSLLTLGTVQVGWMWGSAGIILFDGAGTNQIQTAGNNNLGIMPGGTGNVGIGTANPSQKLDISGNVYTTGNINAPNNTWDGCAWTAYTCDASQTCANGKFVAGVDRYTTGSLCGSGTSRWYQMRLYCCGI